MAPTRPDLDQLDADVRAYIEHLEAQLQADSAPSRGSRASSREASLEPTEAPTSKQLLSVSRAGMAKRTPRHHYSRQRRGGMGVFDLDTDENDPPAFLLVVEPEDKLVVLTDRSRLFQVAVADIPQADVRARGESLLSALPLQPGEGLQSILRADDGAILYLLSDRGWVRKLSSSQLAHVKPGMVLEVRAGHSLAAAAWGSGGDFLFIVTSQGNGIRFAERQVPVSGGCLGIRLDPSEEGLALCAVPDDGAVFMMSDEGKGTVRLMEGFRANKSPGAGGKVAMKADRLVGVAPVQPGDDVFAISRLGKLIRFSADDVPAKTGVVQGVNCMNLRADEVTALTVSDGGEPV